MGLIPFLSPISIVQQMDNLTEHFIDHQETIDDLNHDTDNLNTSGGTLTPQPQNMFDQQIIGGLNHNTDGFNTSDVAPIPQLQNMFDQQIIDDLNSVTDDLNTSGGV